MFTQAILALPRSSLKVFWLLFSRKTKYFRDKTIYTFFTDNIGIAAKLYKAFLLTFFSKKVRAAAYCSSPIESFYIK